MNHYYERLVKRETMLNLRRAEKDLRSAFFAVSDLLGVSKEKIDFFVNRDVIKSIEKDRKRMEKPLERMRHYLEVSFPNYEVHGRIKSLTSILGKFMQDRTLLDAFGFKIVIPTTECESEEEAIERCYEVQKWVEANFKIIGNEVNDRIKNPKASGYQDLKMVVEYNNLMVEIMVQTQKMFDNAKYGYQSHEKAYPWKYHPAIKNLPEKYKEKKI